MKLLQNTSNSSLNPLPGDKTVSIIIAVQIFEGILFSCLQKSKKIFHIVRQQGKGGVVRDGRSQEEGLEEEDEISELEQRLRSARLPEHALKAAKKELKVHVQCIQTLFLGN